MALVALLLRRAAASCRQRSRREAQTVLGSGHTLAARCEGHEGLWLVPHGFVDDNPGQHEGRSVLDGLIALLGGVGPCTKSVFQPGYSS